MRLLSCYITGFGTFNNRSFDLSKDIVLFKEENGWGKTTLADFIKCMFYGLDGGRNKAVENNERMRYQPWSGGAFGGSLVFSVQGNTYRVERTFGKTPSMDSARVYDGNNMLTYAFGENAERLGETLFEVDGESYARSAYVPQGEIRTGGLPDDMKNRLLSLLSNGGSGENGAYRAIEKLEAADRALRAKRRPAKGKLDEIDERLEWLSRQKTLSLEYAAQGVNAKKEVERLESELKNCAEQLERLSSAIQAQNRAGERAAKEETYRTLLQQKTEAEKTLATLQAFFGNVNPEAINVEGLKNAVNEFYALQQKFAQAEQQFSQISLQTQEKAAIQAQVTACQKTVESYELIMEQTGQTDGAGIRRRRKNKKKTKKIIPPKRKSTPWILLLSLFLAVFGAAWVEKTPALGYPLLGISVLGLLFVFFRVLPRRVVVKKADKDEGEEERRSAKEDPDDVDEEFALQYAKAKAELLAAQNRLKNFATDIEQAQSRMTAERNAMQDRLRGLESGICAFLDNFRFEELYDYRMAASTLKERIELYKKAKAEYVEYDGKLKALTAGENEAWLNGRADNALAEPRNVQALQEEKADLERKKEALSETRARLLAQAESLEAQANTEEWTAEEETLLEEKERLERRRRAICAARDFLIRAKENMAARYLEPVEKSCGQYLAALNGQGGARLCFSADGRPLYDDCGAIRELGYYSAGSRELVDFCMRISLADCLFKGEKPPLVLDDPFVNLDDERTEKAKAFIRELSKRYQIVYFTCKNERTV